MAIKNYRTAMVFVLLILLANQSLVLAQPNHDKMRRFHEEKINYFNEKLELNEKETKAFWPVYEDLQHRIMKTMEDEKNLLNYYNNNADALSEDEVKNNIDEFFKLLDQRHELKREYHNKFVDIIGERKTMRMYSLEREFRMYILKKFRSGKGGGKGHNRD